MTSSTRWLRESHSPCFASDNLSVSRKRSGKAQGENVNWLKISNITDYAGRNVAETETMPETKEVVALGTLSVTEIGNSIPFTGKLENLSEFDVARIIREGLIDDHVKVMDGNVEREFNNCLLRYIGTAAGAGYRHN